MEKVKRHGLKPPFGEEEWRKLDELIVETLDQVKKSGVEGPLRALAEAGWMAEYPTGVALKTSVDALLVMVSTRLVESAIFADAFRLWRLVKEGKMEPGPYAEGSWTVYEADHGLKSVVEKVEHYRRRLIERRLMK